jgi:hypothetical protein
MSEYQYYEFQALDRPLTAREMNELRGYSTRAAITSTRFTNHYEWGSFKGNPSKWMEQYFDAFLHVTNWGSHQLMLRLPRRALDPEVAQQYLVGRSAGARVKGEHVILAFHLDSEDYDDSWDDDGSGWLSSLIPLRNDIASGDHRALYLAWLLAGQLGELESNAHEPPAPAGLGQLTAPLKSFVDFLRIDEDLIAIAAERSTDSKGDEPSKKELSRRIAALPELEKTALLVRVIQGEGAALRAELLRRLDGGAGPSSSAKPRTFGQLYAAAEARTEERRRKEEERAAREEARRDREEAEAREKHLQHLAKREPAAWDQVATLVATKKPRDYDEAVRLLVDLRDLGVRMNRAKEAQARIDRICVENAKRPSFLDRLRHAGIIPGPTRSPRSGDSARPRRGSRSAT